MKLKFLNHASVLLQSRSGEQLVVDPWAFGTVFNDSWRLLDRSEPTKALIEQSLLSADYIWVSHEHPDHFHIPTLKLVPEEKRPQITVLFRQEAKTNVVDALKGMGFQVQIITPGVQCDIPGFSLYTLHKSGDTALCITDGEHVVFNQNDCKLKEEQLKTVHSLYPSIDYYLFQFGMAGFVCNADEQEGFARERAALLGSINKGVEILQPKKYIPFASYIEFCDVHNAYLNEGQVSLEYVCTHMTSGVETHIPVPGEVIDLTPQSENQHVFAVNYWSEQCLTEPYLSQQYTSKSEVEETIIRYNEVTAKAEQNLTLTKKLKNAIYNLKPGNNQWQVLIIGVGTVFKLEAKRAGLSRVLKYSLTQLENSTLSADAPLASYKDEAEKQGCDYIASANQLLFAAKFPWGSDTFNIAACFYILNGRRSHLGKLFRQYYR